MFKAHTNRIRQHLEALKAEDKSQEAFWRLADTIEELRDHCNAVLSPIPESRQEVGRQVHRDIEPLMEECWEQAEIAENSGEISWLASHIKLLLNSVNFVLIWPVVDPVDLKAVLGQAWQG